MKVKSKNSKVKKVIIKRNPLLFTFEFLLFNLFRFLYGETIPTTTSSAGIGIAEIESFAVQTIAKIECGIYQVEKTFQIGHYFHTIVFKNLVGGLGFVVEIELVTKA